MNGFLLRLAGLTNQRVLLAGFIMTGLWYFMVYNDGADVQKRLDSVKANLAIEKAKEKESDEALREIAAVQASVGALSDQFKLVSAQLPTDLQMAEIVRTVDKVSQATGLTVKAKEPQPPVHQGVVEMMPLRVTAQGAFSEITMFFYYLSTIERIVRVKSFIITIPTENRKSSRLSLDAEVVSYKFLPAEADKK